MLKHRTNQKRQQNPWKKYYPATGWKEDDSKDYESKYPWIGLTPEEAYFKGREDERQDEAARKLLDKPLSA